MSINELPDDFRETAVKAMPADQPILLKIINYDELHIPEVEFFKRNADGGLFCINKSISVESEMRYVYLRFANFWNRKGFKNRVSITCYFQKIIQK